MEPTLINKQKGFILESIAIFIFMCFVTWMAVGAWEHLYVALGGEPFDVVTVTIRFMWASLVFTVVFLLAMPFIVCISLLLGLLWPIWVIPGLIWYTGELLWWCRYVLATFGIGV